MLPYEVYVSQVYLPNTLAITEQIFEKGQYESGRVYAQVELINFWCERVDKKRECQQRYTSNKNPKFMLIRENAAGIQTKLVKR